MAAALVLKKRHEVLRKRRLKLLKKQNGARAVVEREFDDAITAAIDHFDIEENEDEQHRLLNHIFSRLQALTDANKVNERDLAAHNRLMNQQLTTAAETAAEGDYPEAGHAVPLDKKNNDYLDALLALSYVTMYSGFNKSQNLRVLETNFRNIEEALQRLARGADAALRAARNPAPAVPAPGAAALPVLPVAAAANPADVEAKEAKQRALHTYAFSIASDERLAQAQKNFAKARTHRDELPSKIIYTNSGTKSAEYILASENTRILAALNRDRDGNPVAAGNFCIASPQAKVKNKVFKTRQLKSIDANDHVCLIPTEINQIPVATLHYAGTNQPQFVSEAHFFNVEEMKTAAKNGSRIRKHIFTSIPCADLLKFAHDFIEAHMRVRETTGHAGAALLFQNLDTVPADMAEAVLLYCKFKNYHYQVTTQIRDIEKKVDISKSKLELLAETLAAENNLIVPNAFISQYPNVGTFFDKSAQHLGTDPAVVVAEQAAAARRDDEAFDNYLNAPI